MSVIKAKQLEGIHADQLLDNLITAIVDPTVSNDVSQGYKPSSVWVNTVLDKVFVCSDNSIGAAKWIEIKESSSTSLTVTQAAHGYSLCEVLRFNGTSYVRGQADIAANIGIWLITKIIDVNTFVISQSGYFTGLTGGTANTTSYLSDTVAGGLTSTAPAISQPIIYWTSATTGWVLGYPYSQIPVAPSSTPLGYNDIRTSFTGANWDYEGLTNNGGGISLSGSVVVPGAIAGWRYLVVDTLGVVSVETIPPAEIIADTQQYSPTPVFDVANNGYFSSVNPTYRIIAIGYFDGTNLLETISYGNSRYKKDNEWYALGSGSPIFTSSSGDRLQFTDPFQSTKGTGITCVDNGAGNTDLSGFKITINEVNELQVEIVLATTSQPAVTIQVYKNGIAFMYLQSINLVGVVSGSTFNLYTFSDKTKNSDFYTFVQISNASGSSGIAGIKVTMRN